MNYRVYITDVGLEKNIQFFSMNLEQARDEARERLKKMTMAAEAKIYERRDVLMETLRPEAK